MKFALQFLACTLAVPLAAYLLPGVSTADYAAAAVAGAVIGLVYLLLRPAAKLLLGVFNLFTLGLIGLFMDAAIVYGVSMMYPLALSLAGWKWALPVALCVDAMRFLAGLLSHKRGKGRKRR